MTGALTEDLNSIVVLQKGSEFIDGTPSSYFNDMISFLEGGEDALKKALEIMEYAGNNNDPELIISIDSIAFTCAKACIGKGIWYVKSLGRH